MWAVHQTSECSVAPRGPSLNAGVENAGLLKCVYVFLFLFFLLATSTLFKDQKDKKKIKLQWRPEAGIVCVMRMHSNADKESLVPKNKINQTKPKKTATEGKWGDKQQILINGTNTSTSHFLGALHSSLSAAIR